MLAEVAIREGEDGCLYLSGDLTMTTVTKLLPQSTSISPQMLDLAAVGDTDSATLALLLEWLRHAAKQNRSIIFRNQPPRILALAKISNIDSLLPTI